MLEVLASMMSDAAFDVFRTQKNLAYDAGCVHSKKCGVQGIIIYIQSTRSSPVDLHGEISGFIDDFYQN